MSRVEKYAEAEEQFDNLDYNNQRTLLLFIESFSRNARGDCALNSCPQCPYHDRYSSVCDIVKKKEPKRIMEMIDRLQPFPQKNKFKDLMAA